MYLVSDTSHVPVAFFDFYEDAFAYVCSWTQFPTRYAKAKSIGLVSSEMEEIKNDRNETLGYIRAGITHNPDYVTR